jgi:DNA polymerase-3 subunit delta
MILLLTGDNSFELERERQRIEADFSGHAEKIDGSLLELGQLADLVLGMTLFSPERLIIIRSLSDNSLVWTALSEWIDKVSSYTTIVLIEPQPDRRTKVYKALLAHATVKNFSSWTDREVRTAQQWAITEAKERGFTLDTESAAIIVRRSMLPGEKAGSALIDQWRIDQALTKLSVLDEVTPFIVEDVVEPSPLENVFDLLEAALNGNADKVRHMLLNLELSVEPHGLFGLLGGQVFQLAIVSTTDIPTNSVAEAIGAHAYGPKRLHVHAAKRSRASIKKIVDAFCEADMAMKTSATEPWLLIERALLKVAIIK